YLLISNTLRFICSILLALAFYFILHVARHTFATFALANGVSIESVAKMLGHTNVQMTRHYARVLDRTVIREMSQIKMDFHFSM
ncbi:tyrosine-type recombinase/integrase, partial [Phocaeicola vulgatus]|uniref:tyrosine-type recombinase/integrase n=1 Tax=Phocaeicola vulgatus TaxID=821 RepID=UPI0032E44C80